MAFNPNQDPAEYTATAGQTIFPFTFKIFVDSDILVYLTPIGNTPDDSLDLLSINTDYSVTINGDNGGDITLTTSANLGDKVTIVRALPISRDIDYQTNGDLLADTLDSDQNYQTYLVGDLSAKVAKNLKYPATAQGLDATLPAPNADSYFKWNATATAIENDTEIPQNVQITIDNVALTNADVVTTTTKVNEANTSATNAQLSAWEAEARKLTADSYATEPENVFVKTVTSNGDGTFTYTPTTEYSSYHYAQKSLASTINGTAQRQTFTATAGQTIFTILGGYDAPFADIYLNGSKLINSVDVDVSSGTDIVLSTGASTGDIVDVVAYGAFTVANTYTKAEIDAGQVVLDAVKNVDGAGSELDADTVDGVQGALLGIGGAGYSWVDETANRAVGTTYTNTTGYPICIDIYGKASTGNIGMRVVIDNGVERRNYLSNADSKQLSLSFILPVGSTIQVTESVEGILHWLELKKV